MASAPSAGPITTVLPVGRGSARWINAGSGDGESRVWACAPSPPGSSPTSPFRKAAAELAFVTGIRLSARSVQRDGMAVGGALAAAWAEREQRLFSHQAPLPAQRPRQLHAAMDGVFVPIGREWRE